MTAASSPAVLVVLVAHDGAAWVERTLDALGAQTYQPLEILAVDNASTDGCRELLLDRLGEQRVLLADRDLGFGAAVAMALDAVPAAAAPLALFLHDDCALAPGAIEALVGALVDDPRLAVVGCKLRSWERPGELQSVGWTIDLSGRADSGVDVAELDQGQRDQERRCLYVSTSGMLVRRDVFDALGRFDRRYHLFRDDLDLCWRAWLAGHDVEAVTEAVGEHVAGATNYVRLGQTRFIGPRYFAERNTLATLLKNYGPLRLLLVLPLYALVGLAKVAGFLLTRRVSDAWQTVRAWAWNLLHVRETRRLRRETQDQRRRTDRELVPLFGRITPRVRAYAEAMGAWIAGGDVDPAPEPAHVPGPAPPPPGLARRAVGLARRRPVLVTAIALSVLVVAGGWPLLLPGELRGGALAPWPRSPGAFLSDYASGWHEAGVFGSAAAPSPAQALLGLWHALFLGNSYLASRALLFVPLAAGWVLSLRAAQPYAERKLPRVVGATAYVLSPPALAALTTGNLAGLVVLAVLPGIVAGAVTFARRSVLPARAWRAVAGTTLLAAVGGAFEPLLLPGLAVAGVVAASVGAMATRSRPWRLSLLARFGVAVIGPVVLLLPWSFELLERAGADVRAVPSARAGGQLWRWLLLAPELTGFPGLLAGVGFVLAGLLGLVLGVRRRAGFVASLWTVVLAGAFAAWWLDRTGADSWAGMPLLATAAGFAGLLALAFATGEAQLRRHAFGWRQLAVLLTGAAVAVSLLAVATGLVRTTWDGFVREDAALPAFLATEALEEGPFRVLVLGASERTVSWDVVEGTGPTMAAYGHPEPEQAVELVDGAVADLLDRSDPEVAAELAALGVRYVLVPPGGQHALLEDALAWQRGLEPRPLADGRLLEVTGWLPRAAGLSGDDARAFAVHGELPAREDVVPLVPADDGTYSATMPEPGTVALAEADQGTWRLRTTDGEVRASDGDDLVRFTDVPAGRVRLYEVTAPTRGLAVTGQLLAVLLAISLALRPPGFARRLAQQDPRRDVPEQRHAHDPAAGALPGAFPVDEDPPVAPPPADGGVEPTGDTSHDEVRS